MAKLYCPIRFQHQADDFWTIYKASVCAVERRRCSSSHSAQKDVAKMK